MDEPFTLYQGDALDFLRGLPDKSVDLVLTDPLRPPENGEVVRVKPNDPQGHLTFGESEGEA